MLMHWPAHAGCKAWAKSGTFTHLDLMPTLARLALGLNPNPSHSPLTLTPHPSPSPSPLTLALTLSRLAGGVVPTEAEGNDWSTALWPTASGGACGRSATADFAGLEARIRGAPG